MQGSGEDDDATDILGQDTDTALQEDPALAATEIQPASSDLTETTTLVKPERRKSRRLPPWMAGASLSIAIAVPLVYYLLLQPPPAIDTAPQQDNAYPEAVALAESAMRKGEIATLPAQLLSQLRNQPENTEIRALLDDASRYRDMVYLQESGRQLELADARRGQLFQSSLFAETARQQIDPALPSAAILQGLKSAQEAWRSGDLVAAIATVKQLVDDSGNRQAEAMLYHYSNVVRGYEALTVLVTAPHYSQALLAFYLGLDPRQDQFFWQRLEKDFLSADNQLATDASRQLLRTGLLWSSYHSHGGIGATMRQAVGTDTEFQQRAAELAEADSLVSSVVNLQQPSEEAAAGNPLLPILIQEEIVLQRDHLQVLQRFNKEAVFANRLLMLPAKVASGQPQRDNY